MLSGLVTVVQAPVKEPQTPLFRATESRSIKRELALIPEPPSVPSAVVTATEPLA